MYTLLILFIMTGMNSGLSSQTIQEPNLQQCNTDSQFITAKYGSLYTSNINGGSTGIEVVPTCLKR